MQQGILTLNVAHLQRRHIVAVDRMGIVDLAAGTPAHEEPERYAATRKLQGAVFDDECFVTVTRLKQSKLPQAGWRSVITNAINRVIT
jgi:hypothetical protein